MSLEALTRRRRAFEACLRDDAVRAAATALTDWYASVPDLAVCPCCGYPTLGERRAYDICRICRWEDDGQDDDRAAEVFGGPNGDYSLREARENYVRYGHQYRPAATRSDDLERTRAARARIVATFDALLPEADPAAYVAALPRIKDDVRDLYVARYGRPYPGDGTRADYDASRGRRPG